MAGGLPVWIQISNHTRTGEMSTNSCSLSVCPGYGNNSHTNVQFHVYYPTGPDIQELLSEYHKMCIN